MLSSLFKIRFFFFLLLCLGKFHCFVFQLINPSYASSSLLLNPSSVFSSSVTFFELCNFHLVRSYISISWLKFSLFIVHTLVS